MSQRRFYHNHLWGDDCPQEFLADLYIFIYIKEEKNIYPAIRFDDILDCIERTQYYEKKEILTFLRKVYATKIIKKKIYEIQD